MTRTAQLTTVELEGFGSVTFDGGDRRAVEALDELAARVGVERLRGARFAHEVSTDPSADSARRRERISDE